MKIKLHFLLLLYFVFKGYAASAQGKLDFEFETHDFGTIAEGTQAAYTFRVRNLGNQPAVISDVQASCGCTSPVWTKEPLLPGKIGYVKVVFNSTGRPGLFSKSITITSNAEEPTHVLYIKGEVVPPGLKNNITQEQKIMSPRLAVGSTSYSFGKLEKGQKSTAKFLIKNTGRKELVVQGVRSACNCVSYKVSDSEIKAGQTATLELTYIPMMLKEQNEIVTVLSNDIVMPSLRLTLKADVVEHLAP